MRRSARQSPPSIAPNEQTVFNTDVLESSETEKRDRFIHHIFTTVAPYVDLLSRGFSLGLDWFWRRKAVALSDIKQGSSVLDICAGTGELTFVLLRQVGQEGSVTASDFCAAMLDKAREKSGGRFSNLFFVQADAKAMPFADDTFDAVTVAFGMRNVQDTTLALHEIRRVLRPGGTFLCLELTKPRARWLMALYHWYVFRFMPFVSNTVIKSRAPYLYLPRSIEAFYQPPEFRDVISRSGFSDVAVISLTLGIATVYRGRKADDSERTAGQQPSPLHRRLQSL